MGKGYFKRVIGMCKPWELVYWWALRLLMIGGIVLRLVEADELGMYQPMQMAANLLGMFAFEICQAFPAKTFTRYFSAYFQNITILGFFLASFGGAFLNFYYIIPAYDKALHLFGCMEAVFICYELICAMQLRDKLVVPAKYITLGAFGLAFVFAAGWELFEFSFDQWFGGDAQHWSYENALASAGGDPEKIFNLFAVEDPMRFALMDTMGDMVLNFIGAFLMYWILCIIPYRHKGKGDVNAMIENMNTTNN